MRRFAFLVIFIHSVSMAIAFPQEEVVGFLQLLGRFFRPVCGLCGDLGARYDLTVSR